MTGDPDQFAWAFGLSLSSALLALTEGGLVFAGSVALNSIGLGYVAFSFVGVGLAMVAFGGAQLALSIYLLHNPETHFSVGFALLALSLLSLFLGGGFFIGTLTGAIGGTMVIRYEESDEPEESWTVRSGSAQHPRCPKCWMETRSTARACPYCGAALQ